MTSIQRSGAVQRICRAAAAVGLALAAATAIAQTYPSKVVRIIVPFAAGGSAGAQAQIIQQPLEKDLGQPVIVEYKPGAGTTVGAAFVAKADPDGHTLLYAGTSHTISGSLYKGLSYHAVKDFAAVSMVSAYPLLLVVNESKGIKTVPELVALAKAKPGTLTYSSSGSGGSPHLSGEQFRMLAGIEVVHVPFKGANPALTAVLGQQVDYGFMDMSALSNIKSGKIRALAVTTAHRSSLLPDVPTMRELGYPFETPAWGGLLAPAGTPPAVVRRLNSAVVKALQDPSVREKYTSLGFELVGNAPEEFQAHLAAEFENYARVIRESGATAN